MTSFGNRLTDESVGTPSVPEVQKTNSPTVISQTSTTYSGVALVVITRSEVNKGHTATFIYEPESPTGEGGVALNLISNNLKNSTMFVSGQNTDHATIKLTHTNKSGGESGDKEAAALNLNLVKGTEPGTECQGLRVCSEDDVPNAKGAWITCAQGTSSGGTLKNWFRVLFNGVMEFFDTETAEPKNVTSKPSAGRAKLIVDNKKLYFWNDTEATPKLIV